MYLQMIIYCYHSEDCVFTKKSHKKQSQFRFIEFIIVIFTSIRFSFNVFSLLFDRREIKCRTIAKRVLKIDFWRKGRNVFVWMERASWMSLCGKSMNGRKYQEIIISLRSVDNNYRRIVFTQWNLEILNQTTIKSSTCVATCPIFKSNRFLLKNISKVCYDYYE